MHASVKSEPISCADREDMNMETINDVMVHLTATQLDALAAKFAAQPKAIKKAVRVAEIDGDEATQYAVYILQKTANDYINGQMRDVWIQRLELLVPRVNTSDEKASYSDGKSNRNDRWRD